jgi:phenylpropionate dioxygenase-like ring-hydroxylating dioxygenase large terminal subunit
MTAQLASLLAAYQSGWSLPQPFYVDEAVFQADWEHIWANSWLYVGSTAEIPKPGDFFTYAVRGDSIIVVRGPQGEVFAHHNTCRHRGSIVCLEERGSAKAFRCPYHQWVYGLDGALISARLMPEDFDKTGFGLHPAHVRVLEGLIFVSLAKAAPPFEREAADIAAYMRPFRLGDAKVAHRARYTLRTNWKLIAENFRECYHCGPVHPEYCRAVIGANQLEDITELMAERRPAWREKGLATQFADLAETNALLAVRYPLRPGVETYSLDGKAVSRPMGEHRDHDAGVVGLSLMPGFWVDGVSDYVWTMRVTPLGVSQTVVDATWFVDGAAEEGVDYDVDRLTAFWKVTGGQDWTLCENNFRGVESSRYRPGPYAPAEARVTTFVDWYVGRLRHHLRAKAA